MLLQNFYVVYYQHISRVTATGRDDAIATGHDDAIVMEDDAVATIAGRRRLQMVSFYCII